MDWTSSSVSTISEALSALVDVAVISALAEDAVV